MHTKTETNTEPPQMIGGEGGLNAFYWRQILALNSVVNTQKWFTSP